MAMNSHADAGVQNQIALTESFKLKSLSIKLQ